MNNLYKAIGLSLFTFLVLGCQPESDKGDTNDNISTDKSRFIESIEGAWVRHLENSEYEMVLITENGYYAEGTSYCYVDDSDCTDIYSHELDTGFNEDQAPYDYARYTIGDEVSNFNNTITYQVRLDSVDDLTLVVSLKDSNGTENLLLGSSSDIDESGTFERINMPVIPDFTTLSSDFIGTWKMTEYDETESMYWVDKLVLNSDGTYSTYSGYCENTDCSLNEPVDFDGNGYWAVTESSVDSSGLTFYKLAGFSADVVLNVVYNYYASYVYLKTDANPVEWCETESYKETGLLDSCYVKAN
jgi:hypothetical protein